MAERPIIVLPPEEWLCSMSTGKGVCGHAAQPFFRRQKCERNHSLPPYGTAILQAAIMMEKLIGVLLEEWLCRMSTQTLVGGHTAQPFFRRQ